MNRTENVLNRQYTWPRPNPSSVQHAPLFAHDEFVANSAQTKIAIENFKYLLRKPQTASSPEIPRPAAPS